MRKIVTLLLSMLLAVSILTVNVFAIGEGETGTSEEVKTEEVIVVTSEEDDKSSDDGTTSSDSIDEEVINDDESKDEEEKEDENVDGEKKEDVSDTNDSDSITEKSDSENLDSENDDAEKPNDNQPTSTDDNNSHQNSLPAEDDNQEDEDIIDDESESDVSDLMVNAIPNLTYDIEDLEILDYLELKDRSGNTLPYGEDGVQYIEYDGDTHIPGIKLKNDHPSGMSIRYSEILYYLENVNLLNAEDVGNYVVKARISVFSGDSFIKDFDIEKVQLPFKIIKKAVNSYSVKGSHSIYNGSEQLPKSIFVGTTPIDKDDYQINRIDGDNYTDVGEHILNVEFKNYEFIDLENSSIAPVKYEINRRPVEVKMNDDEYDPSGIVPSINFNDGAKDITLNEIVNDIGDYEITSIIDSNDQVIAGENGKYNLIPGNYKVTVKFSDSCLKNNEIYSADGTMFADETNPLTLDYVVKKATLKFDYDSTLYYNGENQIPELYVIDKNKSTSEDPVVIIDNGDIEYTEMNGDKPIVHDYISGDICYQYKAVGDYFVYVNMPADLDDYYEWDQVYTNYSEIETNVAKVGYAINKCVIEFDRWDIPGNSSITIPATLGPIQADFIWINDNGNVSMQYNGFNPFLFVTEDNRCPIPNAIYKNSKGEDVTDVSRLDTHYYPSLKDLKYWVGEYYVDINVDDNNKYAASCTRATFEVTPKPVTIEWTETQIDISNPDKDPKCEIIGLAPIDKYGFRLAYNCDNQKLEWYTEDKLTVDYSYYKFQTNEQGEEYIVKTHDCPANFVADKEGKYGAEAVSIVYTLTGNVDKNYILTGDNLLTAYTVVDKSTVEGDSNVTVGTIDNVDKDIVEEIKLKAPTSAQMESLISYLAVHGTDEDKETAQVLANALGKKNINFYVVANEADSEEVTKLILSSDSSITIDLELFACVDGDPKQYKLTNTGDYYSNIEILLTEDQARSIGYDNTKAFYIDTFHGSSKLPVRTQIAEPDIVINGSEKLYRFNISTNKFSYYNIYTGTRPIHYEPEDDDDYSWHRVVNTGC